MVYLQPIPQGFGPSEEHIRVLEAYRREFGIPISLPYSTSAFNRAVAWWNTPTTSESPEKGRPFAELADTGLLWLINAAVLHSRGFALALRRDAEGHVTGWSIEGDGTEPWTFTSEDHLIDSAFAAVQQLLAPRNDGATPREGDPHAQ